jgi:SAM-dependent methyltransferase
VVSADCRAEHLANASGNRVAADAFRLPFAARSFDFVFCSLLLHEYSDSDIPNLLERLHRVAGRALIVIDLQRRPAPYYFLPLTRWLFRWGSVTLHDGPASVEAGFTPAELSALANRAGLTDHTVRRHSPWFRLSLVAKR